MHSSGEFLEPDRGLFLIRFRSRDLRVGSRFGRCLLGVGGDLPGAQPPRTGILHLPRQPRAVLDGIVFYWHHLIEHW